MSKILSICFTVLLLAGTQLYAGSSSHATYCWKKDGAPNAHKLLSVINLHRGLKFQSLEIDTSKSGYVMFPKVYNNWFMDTGFELKFSNHYVRLGPLRIASNKLTSQGTVVNNVMVDVRKGACNSNHECSFSVTLLFLTKSSAKYAEITIDIRRTYGVIIRSDDLGRINIITQGKDNCVHHT